MPTQPVLQNQWLLWGVIDVIISYEVETESLPSQLLKT